MSALPRLAPPPVFCERRGASVLRTRGRRACASLTVCALGSEEVSIRRRAPSGNAKLDVGRNFDFIMESVDPSGKRVDNPDNKPRNILEEIVWYKDVEITKARRCSPPRCPAGCSSRPGGAQMLTPGRPCAVEGDAELSDTEASLGPCTRPTRLPGRPARHGGARRPAWPHR